MPVRSFLFCELSRGLTNVCFNLFNTEEYQKSYSGTHVLKKVNLSVKAGEIHSLLGRTARENLL